MNPLTAGATGSIEPDPSGASDPRAAEAKAAALAAVERRFDEEVDAWG